MGLLRQTRRDDSGMALIVAIWAIALMVVLATAGFFVSSQTLFETRRADQHDAAFQAASSGVMVAYADLKSRLAERPSGGTYTGSVATSSAAYVAVATINAAQTAYTCVSTGTSSDGTQEVVEATFAVGTASTTSLPWGTNVFYWGGFSGGTIVSGTTLVGPVYFKFDPGHPGTLDFGSAAGGFTGGPVYVESGSLTIKDAPPAPIDVYTNGTLTLEGNAKGYPERVISHGWDSTKQMPMVLLDQPTYLAAQSARATAQSSDNLMGDTTIVNYEANPVGSASTYRSSSTSPPNNKPSGWTRSKAPNAATAYKVIPHDLSITSSTGSFGSWSGDGHYPTSGDLHDDFAYDSVNHVLYVEGTVYVDGNVTVDAGTRITYVGNGTIVCNGTFTAHTDIVPATANGSDNLPDTDARHLLCVLATGDVVAEHNGVDIIGAFYTAGHVTLNGTGCNLKGSFVSEQGISNIANGATITAVSGIGSYISPGLPSWGTGSSAAGLTMTSWRRI